MKKTNLFRNIFSIKNLLLLFILLAPVTVFAEKEQPITITADEMLSTEATNSVTFKGDVDASQGGVKIRSDEMTIHYGEKDDDSKEKNVAQKVERIICTGNVEITREDWIGTSKKMIYLAKERKILLIGDAKAVQGQNMVNGEKIIYYMDEGRSEVVGGTTTTIANEDGTEKKKKQNEKNR